MKATCPNNPDHKEFVTTAHVMQDWVVDENGDFIKKVEDLQTTHGPNKDNTWTCITCNAEAIVT